MNYYKFHSMFPPRDAMPGDVYLFFAKTNEALSALSPDDLAKEKEKAETRYYFRLTRLDVRTLLRRDWQKRLNLPTTPQNASGKPIDVFTTQKTFTTLPTAAFIGYNIVNITEGEAGVAFPIHLFRTFFGGAFEDQLALSISVPSAQLVELPAIDAFNVFKNFCYGAKTKLYCEEPNLAELDTPRVFDNPVTFVAQQYKDQFGFDPNYYSLGLIFVTDVLYAQEIQYSYSTENGSAFSAAVTPIAALSNQTKASGATATSQTASEGGTTINVNGGAVTATATNGGATACATPAAKTDQTPTKPDITALQQSVAQSEAAAKTAEDTKTTADNDVTSAQADAAKATTADDKKKAQTNLTTKQAAAKTAKEIASTAEQTLTNAKKALAAAQKAAEQPAAAAPGAHPADAAPAADAAAAAVPGAHPADAAPAANAAAAAKGAQDNGCGTTKPSTNAGSSPSNPTVEAEALVQALEAKVAALNQQLGPAGGTATIASVSEQGTVLQQTFPSPVAIGYRGFTIELLPRNSDPVIYMHH
jgi:hypothetical protein